MVRVLTCAEFKSSFPDDQIEDGIDVIQWGGLAVTEAIAAIFSRAGYQISPIENLLEKGREFGASKDNAEIWLRITDIGDSFLLFSNFSPRKLTTKNVDYLETLLLLNENLRADERFLSVRWYTEKTISTGAPGSPVPGELSSEVQTRRPSLLSRLFSKF